MRVHLKTGMNLRVLGWTCRNDHAASYRVIAFAIKLNNMLFAHVALRVRVFILALSILNLTCLNRKL